MSAVIISQNPATGEILERYSSHSDMEVHQRLDAAKAAQVGWQSLSLKKRAAFMERAAELLEQRRDDLAELATREMGKLRQEALGEVDKCAWVCRYYAEHSEAFLADQPLQDDADKQSFVSHHPLGVVLAVMPWNFPFWQVYRCAVPALMAGNTVVLKHASNVTGCALAMEQLFRDAGLPGGAFSVLIIRGSQTSALLEDHRIAAASVTGSEKAGGSVAAAAGGQIKPTVLELGGSDPFIVIDMDDTDTIIENAVTSRFQNCGQSCIAAKRFIVLDAVYEQFLEAFQAAVAKLVPGENYAPMARADLRDELQEQVDDAQQHGAKILTGGTPSEGDGYFYPPTIITELHESCRLYREEAFGPVASVYRAKDVDAAIQLANTTPFGLGGSVWCADVDKGIEVARRVDSGAVYVNRMMASDPRLPFGGTKLSGYGRELSQAGILEFVNRKTISVQM